MFYSEMLVLLWGHQQRPPQRSLRSVPSGAYWEPASDTPPRGHGISIALINIVLAKPRQGRARLPGGSLHLRRVPAGSCRQLRCGISLGHPRWALRAPSWLSPPLGRWSKCFWHTSTRKTYSGDLLGVPRGHGRRSPRQGGAKRQRRNTI